VVRMDYYKNLFGPAIAKLSWAKVTSVVTPPVVTPPVVTPPVVTPPVVTPPVVTPPATCPAPATNAFTGCYYSTGPNFFNTLLLTRTDAAISFDWTNTPPAPGVPTYNLSVQWAGNFTFEAGTYTFTLTTNDGSRLWIDPTKQIPALAPNPALDVWFLQNTNTYTVTVQMTAGVHVVRSGYR
jgi:PA14 domain